MTERSRRRAIALEDIDFKDLFHGAPTLAGTEIRLDAPPWDIGEPQPFIVALAEAGLVDGDVLDSGCGLGTNAMYLARHGFRVTGVDNSPTALEQARDRARTRGVPVDFALADATGLDGLGHRFTTVLDCGLYYRLGGQERIAYSAALHRVTRPGAHLHLFCFRDTGSDLLPLPSAFGQDDLLADLGDHWDIRSIEPTEYRTALTREAVASLGRAGIEIDVAARRTDEWGRVLLPAWHLHATRR